MANKYDPATGKYVNKVVYGNETLMDLTDASLTSSDADQLLTGNTAYGADGSKVTGTCDYDANTSDATALASEILQNKSAYVNRLKVTGTMPNIGGEGGDFIDTKTEQVTIARGYHDGTGKVAISQTEQAKIIAGNIKSGVQILGVTGNYSGESGQGQAKTVTPYTTQQVVLPDSGYDYLTQVTVNAISYTVTSNTYGQTVTIGDEQIVG